MRPRRSTTAPSSSSRAARPRPWTRRAALATDGKFEVHGLETGNWTVTVPYQDSVTKKVRIGEARVEITEGRDAEVRVSLR